MFIAAIASIVCSSGRAASGASARAAAASVSPDGRQRRKVSAFVTTLTLLRAIAAPAMTGLSRPRAASGMPSTLYAKAQPRFCLIFE